MAAGYVTVTCMTSDKFEWPSNRNPIVVVITA